MVEEAGDGHDIYSSYKSIHNASFSQYNNIIIINLYICKLPVGRLSLRSLRATVVATENLFTMLTKMYNFIILLNDEPPLPFCLILPPPSPQSTTGSQTVAVFFKVPSPMRPRSNKILPRWQGQPSLLPFIGCVRVRQLTPPPPSQLEVQES